MTASPDHSTPRRPRRRRLLVLGLLPLAGVVASACSSGNGATTTTTTTTAAASTPTAAPQAHPLITTMNVGSLGKILVNNQGQVLYTFTKNGAPVSCSSSCLQVWPAVNLPAGTTTPTGAAGVGTLATTTTNGVTQVTVGGLPLYTYAGDSAPGVANGNNVTSFGGTWKVVKAASTAAATSMLSGSRTPL